MPSKFWQTVVSVLNKLAYSTALAFLSWFTAVTPADPPVRQVLGYTAYVLNFPLAVASRITPGGWHGNLVFDDHFGHWLNWSEVLHIHLRFAVLAYFGMSYLPGFAWWLAGKLRRRKGSAVSLAE